MTIELSHSQLLRIIPKIIQNWGSISIVSKGKIHNLEELSVIAECTNDEIHGVCFYEILNNECEIVLLESYKQNIGIGSNLLQAIISISKNKSLNRIWLITTNDNINALQFYQKHGFHLCNLYPDAIEYSRKIKPEIPMIGNHGIEIRDELELEILITY